MSNFIGSESFNQSELVDAAVKVGEDTYPRIFAGYGAVLGIQSIDVIHQSAVCTQWSSDAHRSLEAHLSIVGFTGSVCVRRFSVGAANEHLRHDYIELSTDDGSEPLMADGTWQQFLPEANKTDLSLPRVLAGTYHDCIELALEAGVPEQAAMLWDRSMTIEI